MTEANRQADPGHDSDMERTAADTSCAGTGSRKRTAAPDTEAEQGDLTPRANANPAQQNHTGARTESEYDSSTRSSLASSRPVRAAARLSAVSVFVQEQDDDDEDDENMEEESSNNNGRRVRRGARKRRQVAWSSNTSSTSESSESGNGNTTATSSPASPSSSSPTTAAAVGKLSVPKKNKRYSPPPDHLILLDAASLKGNMRADSRQLKEVQYVGVAVHPQDAELIISQHREGDASPTTVRCVAFYMTMHRAPYVLEDREDQYLSAAITKRLPGTCLMEPIHRDSGIFTLQIQDMRWKATLAQAQKDHLILARPPPASSPTTTRKRVGGETSKPDDAFTPAISNSSNPNGSKSKSKNGKHMAKKTRNTTPRRSSRKPLTSTLGTQHDKSIAIGATDSISTIASSSALSSTCSPLRSAKRRNVKRDRYAHGSSNGMLTHHQDMVGRDDEEAAAMLVHLFTQNTSNMTRKSKVSSSRSSNRKRPRIMALHKEEDKGIHIHNRGDDAMDTEKGVYNGHSENKSHNESSTSDSTPSTDTVTSIDQSPEHGISSIESSMKTPSSISELLSCCDKGDQYQKELSALEDTLYGMNSLPLTHSRSYLTQCISKCIEDLRTVDAVICAHLVNGVLDVSTVARLDKNDLDHVVSILQHKSALSLSKSTSPTLSASVTGTKRIRTVLTGLVKRISHAHLEENDRIHTASCISDLSQFVEHDKQLASEYKQLRIDLKTAQALYHVEMRQEMCSTIENKIRLLEEQYRENGVRLATCISQMAQYDEQGDDSTRGEEKEEVEKKKDNMQNGGDLLPPTDYLCSLVNDRENEATASLRILLLNLLQALSTRTKSTQEHRKQITATVTSSDVSS